MRRLLVEAVAAS